MVISSEIILATIIALPFVGSCLAVLFRTNMRTAEAFLAGFVAIAALALLIVTYPRVVDGGIVQYKAEWFPELGLEFYLRMDGFAWVMASLVTGIGVLVVLYARYYLSSADSVPRFMIATHLSNFSSLM